MNKEIVELRKENKEAHEKIEQDDLGYYLATNKHIDTASVKGTKEILPTLAILNRPKLTFTKKGERVLHYELVSIDAESHILDDYNVSMLYKKEINGSQPMEKPRKERSLFNKSEVLPSGGTHTFSNTLSPVAKYCIIVTEILYESKNGTLRPPMIKMYNIQDSIVSDLPNFQYNYVYSILSQSHLIIGK